MRTVTLTFDQATRFLFATHRLVMMLICAKLFSSLTMQDEVMGRTRFWNTQTNKRKHTQTHTHIRTGVTLYALPPFHGGGIMTNPQEGEYHLTHHMLAVPEPCEV